MTSFWKLLGSKVAAAARVKYARQRTSGQARRGTPEALDGPHTLQTGGEPDRACGAVLVRSGAGCVGALG